MARPDALRASLDSREVDRKARRERQYVESVLRRIGPAPEATPTTDDAPTAKPSEESAAMPTFDRVKPVKHPKQAEEDAAADNAVAFKQLSARQKRKRAKQLQRLDEEEPSEEEPVADAPEPQGRAPDPAAGYMKGNFALLRRHIDDDHAVYFFATEVPDDAKQTRVPSGYEVRLTPETKLPYIAKRGSENNTVQVRAKDRDEAMSIAARKGIGGIHGE